MIKVLAIMIRFQTGPSYLRSHICPTSSAKVSTGPSYNAKVSHGKVSNSFTYVFPSLSGLK